MINLGDALIRLLGLPLDVLDLGLLHLAKLRKQRVGDFYDGYFSAADLARYGRDIRHVWRHTAIGQTPELLTLPNSAWLLDVGCGLGFLARYLPSSLRYLGVEYSAATIRLARETVADRPLVRGGFPSLPFKNECLDVIVALEVLEHVEDDRNGLRELRRVIRRGGYLILAVPKTRYWSAYLKLMGHYRHYRGPELRELLASCGFRTVRGIPQHVQLWRLYHYLHLSGRLFEKVWGLTGHRAAFYDSSAYNALSRLLLTRLQVDPAVDDLGSTFIVAVAT